MVTYSIREFKSKVSEILRSLEYGQEATIPRHVNPCGKLTPVQPFEEEKPSLRTLRGSMASLPDASSQDFVEVKSLWEPRLPGPAEAQSSGAEQAAPFRSRHPCVVVVPSITRPSHCGGVRRLPIGRDGECYDSSPRDHGCGILLPIGKTRSTGGAGPAVGHTDRSERRRTVRLGPRTA